MSVNVWKRNDPKDPSKGGTLSQIAGRVYNVLNPKHFKEDERTHELSLSDEVDTKLQTVEDNVTSGFLQSENLFLSTAVTSGKILQANGSYYEPMPTYSVSHYIEVIGGETYTIYGYGESLNSPSLCWYSDTYDYISGESYAFEEKKTLQAPTNAKYLRITVSNSNLNTAVVCKGSNELETYIQSSGLSNREITKELQTKIVSTNNVTYWYKKCGERAYLLFDTCTSIITLPLELRPSHRTYLPILYDGSHLGMLKIDTNGSIEVRDQNGTNPNTYKLYGEVNFLIN